MTNTQGYSILLWYRWFSKGFDAVDLQDLKTLLEDSVETMRLEIDTLILGRTLWVAYTPILYGSKIETSPLLDCYQKVTYA